jgi:hypothetical protein
MRMLTWRTSGAAQPVSSGTSVRRRHASGAVSDHVRGPHGPPASLSKRAPPIAIALDAFGPYGTSASVRDVPSSSEQMTEQSPDCLRLSGEATMQDLETRNRCLGRGGGKRFCPPLATRLPANPKFTRVRFFKPCDKSQNGRLAATARAKQCYNFTFRHI